MVCTDAIHLNSVNIYEALCTLVTFRYHPTPHVFFQNALPCSYLYLHFTAQQLKRLRDVK